MSRVLIGKVSRGLFAIAVVCVATMAPAVDASDDAALAPQLEPQFKPGDVLTVAADQANLMLGTDVLATLPQGRRVVVAAVQEGWIGTLVSVQGQTKAGWIPLAAFIPSETLAAASSSTQVYTVARQVEPAAESRPAVRFQVPSEPRDAYLIGRYDRHELDPNVHAWEPWRQ